MRLITFGKWLILTWVLYRSVINSSLNADTFSYLSVNMMGSLVELLGKIMGFDELSFYLSVVSLSGNILSYI